MAIFGFIGLPAPLLDHFVSSDTCANARERNAGAAAAGMVGMGAGALGGFLMGAGGDRDSWIDGGVGAVLGGIAGRAIANAAVDQAAGLAGRGAEQAMRDYAANFEFNVCQILNSSGTIRGLLLARYVQIAPANCRPIGRASSQLGNLTPEEADRFIYCANGSVAEAREITLRIIELNRLTCEAILILYNGVAQEALSDPEMRSYMPPQNPTCPNEPASTTWQGFVQGR